MGTVSPMTLGQSGSYMYRTGPQSTFSNIPEYAAAFRTWICKTPPYWGGVHNDHKLAEELQRIYERGHETEDDS